MTETRDLSDENRFQIFQALSHPVRVKILVMVSGGCKTFSSLKHELGIESSGQLQHHMQKLSGLVGEDADGTYVLTFLGKRAIEIYRQSEKSESSLRDCCTLPSPSTIAQNHQINRKGALLRFSLGIAFSIITAALIANYFLAGKVYFTLGGATLWIGDAVLFGFFGISFLLVAFTGFPGCEITAIPNLFTHKKRYCGCLITPFNIPNGSLVELGGKSKAD
jgi:hypothetical protein